VNSLLRSLAGIASVVPLVSVFSTAGYSAYVLLDHDVATGGAMLADPVSTFIDLGLWQVVLGASVAIALFQLALMVAFSVHALTRKQLASGTKVLWIAGFYLFGMFAMPVYWLLYMLPRAATPPAHLEEPAGGWARSLSG
jgi:hypothetical protein